MTARDRLNLRFFNLGLSLLHNNDSLNWGCWNIDVVNACSCATDNFKIFSSLDHFSSHLCSWSNNQTIIVLRKKRSVQWKPKVKLNRLTTVHVHVALPSLTAISARSSSLVSFVFKSTAMPFASRIVLQQLSTLSLINTRLRSNENAILSRSLSQVWSIAEWNFHVYTLCELLVTAAACDWFKRTAITCRNFPAIIWKKFGSFDSQC